MVVELVRDNWEVEVKSSVLASQKPAAGEWQVQPSSLMLGDIPAEDSKEGSCNRWTSRECHDMTWDGQGME